MDSYAKRPAIEQAFILYAKKLEIIGGKPTEEGLLTQCRLVKLKFLIIMRLPFLDYPQKLISKHFF